MKVVIYPADRAGCGHHRLIWPGEVLRAQGHDVEVVMPENRELEVKFKGKEVVAVGLPEGTDVVVFQRVTHRAIPLMMKYLMSNGIAVVVDIDDDLSAIHPSNPAAKAMGLEYTAAGKPKRDPGKTDHSWMHLEEACKWATMVTVATDELVKVYGKHRPHRVLYNYLSHIYFDDVLHHDSEVIGWPASIHSHPNDPQVMGTAMRDLIAEGADFAVIAEPQTAVVKAFQLKLPPRFIPGVPLLDWPRTIAQLGIGIVPLANTKFNRGKSWLKGLELSAVGVPWIASPRNEYRRLNGLGAGRLAGKPSDWLRELRALRASESMRKELSDAGYEVAKTLRIEDNAWRYIEAWADALKLVRR